MARIQAETKATPALSRKRISTSVATEAPSPQQGPLHKIQDLKGAIRVYTRIRPLQTNDPHGESMVVPGRCLDPAAEGMDAVCKPAPVTKLSNPGERRPAGKRLEEKRFSFDRVFGPDSTQSDVYEEVSPVVMGVLDGYNACVFAYGQTGSGKTHTMGGPDGASQHEELVGINDRALTELRDCQSEGDGRGFVHDRVEMREIYNEQTRDLLRRSIRTPPGTGLSAQVERRPTTSSEGTTTRRRGDEGDGEGRARARDNGRGNREEGQRETKMNERSSRSTRCYRVRRGFRRRDGRGHTGRLHPIDLAGSERVARSEATATGPRGTAHQQEPQRLGDVIAAPSRSARTSRFATAAHQALSDPLGVTVVSLRMSPRPAAPDAVNSLFAQRRSQVELGKAKVNATGGGG